MAKKFVIIAAALLLAICLISGGCSSLDESKVQSWKDMIKIPTEKAKTTTPAKNDVKTGEEVAQNIEHIKVKLYFKKADNNMLGVEERSIVKAEGIARQTMEELLKGPSLAGFVATTPTGTRLLDINLKPDGTCIVDLSSEAATINNEEQEHLMLYAIADTLGQFPTVKELSFMINGENVTKLGGYTDLSKPILPDYSLLSNRI